MSRLSYLLLLLLLTAILNSSARTDPSPATTTKSNGNNDKSDGGLLHSSTTSRRLVIGLHAQVDPSSGVVVGSAITTRGLREAFARRHWQVDRAVLLYPANYSNYFRNDFDLIIIEGWFPSIHQFIATTRALSPRTIILFYCLDPAYPGLDTITSLGVDGYLSNSLSLVNSELSNAAPAIYLPLAADPLEMAPVPGLQRDIPAVYVGAGKLRIFYFPFFFSSSCCLITFFEH